MTSVRTPNGRPLRLNLGAGNRATPGWVCIDRSPNVFLSRVPAAKTLLRKLGVLSEGHMSAWDREIERQDIRALKYPDASADAVYSSHALEHIYFDEARKVLAEASRVLVSGGIIRLALPDSTSLARKLLDDPDSAEAAKEFNRGLFAFPESPPTGLRRIVARSSGDTHRWQPTPALVRQMLVEAGFVDVTERRFREGDLPGVESIETRRESFFIEARRP